MTTSISTNSTATGQLLSSTQVDSYSLTLSGQTVQNFSLTTAGASSYPNWEYVILVYNSSNQLLGSNFLGYSHSPNFTLSLPSGSYTIQVESYNQYGSVTGGYSSNPYTLQLTTVNANPVNYAQLPNFSLANASPLSVNYAMYGQLAYSGIVNYYSYSLASAGQELIFNTPTGNTTQKFVVSLLNSQGQTLASYQTSSGIDRVLPQWTSGSYYVSVTSLAGTGYDGNNYGLQVSSYGTPFEMATGSVIAKPYSNISLSSLFTTTSDASAAPKYIGVTMFDRIEYAGAKVPLIGTFLGNGHYAPAYQKQIISYSTKTNENIDETAILFTHQSGSGRYYSSTYGYLDELVFVTGSGDFQNAEISLFSSNNADNFTQIDPTTNNGSALYDTQYLTELAAQHAGVALMGTVSIVNHASAIATRHLNNPTPLAIAGAAQNYIGQVWDVDGCWVLAADIAADAGASLPASSLALGSTPIGNGAWIVAYDATSQPTSTVVQAESYLRPGDVVTVSWSGGGGHVLTVVSGYGAAAMAIDNAQSGSNSARNGVATDIIILPAHSVVDEFQYNGAVASSITIYRLDTPTISMGNALSTSAGQTISLAQQWVTTDAGGLGHLPITQYQIYDVGTGSAQINTFSIAGVNQGGYHDATHPLTLNSSQLSSLNLNVVNGVGGQDAVYVRAYNGSYWGDWSSFTVTETASYNASLFVGAIPQRLEDFYIAYYGRAADYSGLQYWQTTLTGSLNNNQSLMCGYFGNPSQTEFTNLYGTANSDTTFLNNVYTNLFGRSTDAEGLNYWKGVITQLQTQGKTQDQSRATVVIYILDGATGADATMIANKLTNAVGLSQELMALDVTNQYENASNTSIFNTARTWMQTYGAYDYSNWKGNQFYIDGAASILGSALVNISLSPITTVTTSSNLTLTANTHHVVLAGSAPLTVTGNALNNEFTGNGVSNTLFGAGGNDSFIFNTAPSSNNILTLADFTANQDTMVLDHHIYTQLGLGNLDANSFYAAANIHAAHASTDRVVYDTASGALYYTPQGSAGAATEIALIGQSTHALLSAKDFVVI